MSGRFDRSVGMYSSILNHKLPVVQIIAALVIGKLTTDISELNLSLRHASTNAFDPAQFGALYLPD